MNIHVSAELIKAYHGAVREIDAALPDPLPPLDPDKLRAKLAGLRPRLADPLATLREELTDLTSADQARRLIRPLVFLIDEKVLARLPDLSDVEWRALQGDFAVEGGGDVFFEDVKRFTSRKKLEPSESDVDVTAEYLFCLRAGFKGRYFADLAAARDAADSLADELPRPAPLVVASLAEGPAPQPRSLFSYVAAALVAVLALQAVLLAISSIL